MVESVDLWAQAGLRSNQIVECVVTAHRDRFGVDVDVISPVRGFPAFIDFILLTEPGVQSLPENFPPVGTVLRAVTLDFMPFTGELRLSARPSSLSRAEG